VTRALLIQGTGSDVGKSLIVAGLCRAFTRRGLRVRPFKPQNMSNNAAVTEDGGEIGRAQALQARACGVPPSTDMNPVLLKPQARNAAQIVLCGKVLRAASAREYRALAPSLRPAVLDAFGRLATQADLVLVEGAGSPAEINLRAGDIANMGFAEAADVPVALVGDIDRGGVIAQLVGTHAPCFGVVPWFPEAGLLPAEDSMALAAPHPNPLPARGERGRLKIAVPRLPHIANFDDLDPLRAEPSVELVFVQPGTPLPGDAALVILPGSKATLADLTVLRREGWDIDLLAHHRRGGQVLGICGGYQMLGQTIADPDGIEGPAGTVEGLGLLDVSTVMNADKSTRLVQGVHCSTGTPIEGYEIHLGRSEGRDCTRPVVTIDGRADGAGTADGRVQGTYVHGLFTGDAFRKAWLANLGIASTLAYEAQIETALDELADHLEAHLDIEAILGIARSRQTTSASAA
jgi:adenosylcobyric acid synthase